MKRATGLIIPSLVDASGDDGTPRYARLYRRIREVILSGAIRPGQRLPSARSLATDIGASRTTVEAALGQLWAEGFIERRVGSGTFVAQVLPGPAAPPVRKRPLPSASETSPLAERGRRLEQAAAALVPSAPLWFSACVPDLSLFPLAAWQQVAARQSRRGRELLRQPEPAGLPALRDAIATHLVSARGVRCDARQVIVLSSTQQALDLTARLLLDPDDPVWFEDPGHLGARAAFAGAGARLVPVAVDAEGLDLAAALEQSPDARLAYVTPSHQFPTGATLSLARRLQLLDWARRTNGWIFEDDYDSEFRYHGEPITALQGLDPTGRVLYAGTFNKMLFPGIRAAFLVVPESLIEPFRRAIAVTAGEPATGLQATLAAFLSEGHFAAHLRRLRQLYGERRDALLAAIGRHLDSRARLGPVETGLHAVVWLDRGRDDRTISTRAADSGMDLPPVSRYRLDRSGEPGLVLTYAGESPERIDEGIHRLSRILPAAKLVSIPRR